MAVRKFTALVTYRLEITLDDPLPDWYTSARFRQEWPKGIKSIARKELMSYVREHAVGLRSSNGAVCISRATKGTVTKIEEVE
jgi:hypothetical protein